MKKLMFLLCAALGSMSLANAATPEVFLSASSPNSPGTGTQADPYDASTTAKFDAVMTTTLPAAFPPGPLLIHIMPGNYTTKGSVAWQMQSGWSIQGGGIDKTIIKLASFTNSHDRSVVRGGTASFESLEVCDVTLDADFDNQLSSETVSATLLIAKRTRTERVKAIHSGGLGTETFTIVSADGTQPSFHIIKDCILAEPGKRGSTHSDFISGISAQGTFGGGIIEGCIVYGDGVTLLSATSLAGSCTGGYTIRNNSAYDCFYGFHMDTTTSGVPMNGLQITGNHFFKNFGAGVHLNGNGGSGVGNEMHGIVIENNLITLSGTGPAGIFGEGGLVNCQFRANTFQAASGSTSPYSGVCIYNTGNSNNFFEDNRCGVGMTHYVLASVGFGRGNLQLNGTVFSNGGGSNFVTMPYP